MTSIQKNIKSIKENEAEEVKILLDRCVSHMTPIREEDYNMARDAFQKRWGIYWADALTK